MHGIQHPRVRPYVQPGERITLGKFGLNVPSPAHGIGGATVGLDQGGPTHWTPHGIFVALQRAHRAILGRPGVAAASPGAFYTPPALFQLIGIPNGFLFPNAWPVGGPKRTPPIRHQAINTFPAFKPPLPSYPAPAAWPGSF